MERHELAELLFETVQSNPAYDRRSWDELPRTEQDRYLHAAELIEGFLRRNPFTTDGERVV